jgi:hypothetical protein
MFRSSFMAYLAILAVAAPAFAQSTSTETMPTQGTVKPRHWTHPAPAHKMPSTQGVDPDHSADVLNAKELASLMHGAPAAAAPMPAAPKPAQQ